jgi:hypothetical protein
MAVADVATKGQRLDMDIQAWYTRIAIDMIIRSKVAPVYYYSLVTRK